MIHKTAIVDKNAKISNDVEIGPYSIIGPDVEIGTNTVLHSHVNIVGNTKIGKNNHIYPFSSIGTPPQDLKYNGEKNSLIIGNNNKFREYVNVNPGTEQGGRVTSIGDNNLFMVYCHVAHDCKISRNIVLALFLFHIMQSIFLVQHSHFLIPPPDFEALLRPPRKKG